MSATKPIHDDPDTVTPHEVHAYKTDIQDIPAWNITLLAALQLMMSNISSIVGAAYVVHSNICAGDNNVLFAELISVTLVMSGVSTLIQVAIGVRLPILQGSSYLFMPVIAAMMNTAQWRCPDFNNNNSTLNWTNATGHIDVEPWAPRLLQISGSLAVASCIQVTLGLTGLIGFITHFVGPMTIITIMSLLGITMYDIGLPGVRCQWGIAVLSIALVILFSLVLDKVQIPFPAYNRQRGWYTVRYPVFQFFPNLLSLGLSWLLCYVLTVTDVFPDDPSNLQYRARTDVKLDVFDKTKWFFLPYPGMWGTPTFGVGTFIGMLGATIGSTLESVGDYYTTATVCDVPPPPKHAINRGIAAEGLASILSGMMGACHPTTSYSNTMGIIQITGVRSRIVFYVYGGLMMAFGVCGKIGAALSIVPEPIIGASTTLSFGMVTAIGLSLIKSIAASTRNMLILGISIMFGVMLPHAVEQNPQMIQTGSPGFDDALGIILSTGLFIGGMISLILDNIIPGTKEERGMARFPDISQPNGPSKSDKKSVYDIPFISPALRRVKCFEYVPILPNYKQPETRRCSRKLTASSGEVIQIEHQNLDPYCKEIPPSGLANHDLVQT